MVAQKSQTHSTILSNTHNLKLTYYNTALKFFSAHQFATEALQPCSKEKSKGHFLAW